MHGQAEFSTLLENLRCTRVPQRGLARTSLYLWLTCSCSPSSSDLSYPNSTRESPPLVIAQEPGLMTPSTGTPHVAASGNSTWNSIVLARFGVAKKCRGPRMRGVCDHGKTYHEGISSVSFLRRVGSMGVLIFESRVACPSAVVPYTGTNIVKGTRLGGGAMVSGVRSGSGIRATAAGDRNKCGTVPVRWGPTIYVGWPRPADVYTLQGRTITPYRAPPRSGGASRRQLLKLYSVICFWSALCAP